MTQSRHTVVGLRQKRGPVILTCTAWVQFLPSPTHETCLSCSAMTCLMKKACLIQCCELSRDQSIFLNVKEFKLLHCFKTILLPSSPGPMNPWIVQGTPLENQSSQGSSPGVTQGPWIPGILQGSPLDILWDRLPDILIGFLVVDNLRGPPPNKHLLYQFVTAWSLYRQVSESRQEEQASAVLNPRTWARSLCDLRTFPSHSIGHLLKILDLLNIQLARWVQTSKHCVDQDLS